MYHRILPLDDARASYEEPGMFVTPETFAMHMKVLKESQLHFVDLEKWLANPNDYKERCCVAITFDDGWADNYEFALPILKEYQVPSTIFIVHDHVGKQVQFWPNRIASNLLAEKPNQELAAFLSTKTGVDAETVDKEQVSVLIDKLKRYPDAEINRWLDDLKIQSPIAREMMSDDEILSSVKDFNVSIGCHTRTHKRLIATTSKEELVDEILMSKTLLEERYGRPVPLFCFPNGDYSANALELVKGHYSGAVTTERGHNDQIESHELKRIGVHEDIAKSVSTFKARITGKL